MSHEGSLLLDCTLRDGGYYNAWDFPPALVHDYLKAVAAAGVDWVELGFRSLQDDRFLGAFAYTRDDFIRSLEIPAGLRLGVMVNASEVVSSPEGIDAALSRLFSAACDSPIDLVRFACHYRDLAETLQAADWLMARGYQVGINVMQISERTREERVRIGELAAAYPLAVLYFADSMGSLEPGQILDIVEDLRTNWEGALGIHAHDNLGSALANTLEGKKHGVTWLDSTVTGMGRGPGNTRLEYLLLELASRGDRRGDIGPLLSVIREGFGPLHRKYGWGSNPYYYLAGKHGIHPTYIQEMLGDSRYTDEDILAVIDHLREVGGSRYDAATLEAGRNFFGGELGGSWQPAEEIRGREVLVVGPGPGLEGELGAIESYIRMARPYVIALNTEDRVAGDLVDIRAACHPVRMLADCEHYTGFPHRLATPASRLPSSLAEALEGVALLDFGLSVCPGAFEANADRCTLPQSLVIAYALAIAASGRARRILLAGFDGYGADDPRRREVDAMFQLYRSNASSPVLAVTPSLFDIPSCSVHALMQ